MAVAYLKKTKLYNLTKSLLQYDDMPSIRDCFYKFYRGHEWLSFYTQTKTIKIGCRRYSNGYVWFHVEEYDEDENLIRDEIIKNVHVDVA